MPVDLYISYAPSDVAFCNELVAHLALLRRNRVVAAWHAQEIKAGQDWKAAIEHHLASSRFIVLLISADFLNSDFLYHTEMSRALARARRGDACVIPVLIRPCDWQNAPFESLWLLPRSPEGEVLAVAKWPNRDEAWQSVVRRIRETVLTPGKGATHAPMTVIPAMASRPGPAGSEPSPASGARVSSTPGASHARPISSSRPSISSRASTPSYRAQTTAPASQPPYSHGSAPAMGTRGTSRIPSSHTPSKGGSRWGLALAIVAVAVTAVALWIAWRRDRADVAPPGLRPVDPSIPAQTPPSHITPTQHPSPSVPATAVLGAACTPPCCGGVLCAPDAQSSNHPLMKASCSADVARCAECPSRRECVPFACGTTLDPAKPYKLKVAHVAPEPPATARACVRHAGANDWQCTPMSDVADRRGAPVTAGMSTRLPITIADIMTGQGKGIDIVVLDGEVVLGAHYAASHNEIGAAALCAGLKFVMSTQGGTTFIREVHFYLDDP